MSAKKDNPTWKHGMMQGHTKCVKHYMDEILASATATVEAKALAVSIRDTADLLATALKERVK